MDKPHYCSYYRAMQQELNRTRAPRSAYELVFETVRAVGPLFRTDEALRAADTFDMTESATHQALGAAVRGGVIERLRTGLYLAGPPLRSREPHEYLVATRAVDGAAIAGQSALAFWGLIDQEPVDMVTAVVGRAFSVRPSPDQADDWPPAGITIHGVRYVYRRVAPSELVGAARVHVDDVTEVAMFDRERMLIDTVLHPRAYGGSTAAYILSERSDELDMDVVERYAAELGATNALRRSRHVVEGVVL